MDYKQVPYHAAELLPCGFCGSVVHMYQHTTARTVDFVVMCSLIEEGSPTGDDCPLVMPPESFYAATKREAAKYWNEWAQFKRGRDAAMKALTELVFMARTTGGTAGRDEALCRACDQAEAIIGQKVPACARRKPGDEVPGRTP